LPFCSTHGQDQERKLIDRIMKPDMTLGSDAQNKKFTADKTSVHKQAHVSTFYLEQKSPAKTYHGTRDFQSNQYHAGSFQDHDQRVAAALGEKTAGQSTYTEATKTANTRQAYDQKKAQASRDYAGNRPYLDKGKSQKFLNRKNKPMTIEEVRELLNKNK